MTHIVEVPVYHPDENVYMPEFIEMNDEEYKKYQADKRASAKVQADIYNDLPF